MEQHRLSNLLFLSGLASLGLAGCDGDDDESTSAMTSVSATVGDTDGMSSSGTTDAAMTSDGSATGDPTEPPGDSSVCMELAARAVECESEDGYDVTLDYCNETLEGLAMLYSADCSVAYEELFACFVTLDCADFNGDLAGCEEAWQQTDESCGGGSTSG